MFDTVRSRASKKSYAIFILGFFASVFLSYAYILSPYAFQLQPDAEHVAQLQAVYPYVSDIIGIYGSWCHIAFYVVADISGNVLLTYTFWLLIGQITDKQDMKRIYPVYGLFGNLCGNIAAGLFGLFLSGTALTFTELVRVRINVVACFLIISSFIVYYLYDHYVSQETLTEEKTVKKSKPGFVESIKLLASSKELFYLAMITLAYGMSVNLADITFKSVARELSGGASEFMKTLDTLFVVVGISAFFTTIFNRQIMQKFGGFQAAIAPPIMLSITATLFFGMLMVLTPMFGGGFAKIAHTAFESIGITKALAVVVFLGALHNVLGKVSKYTMIDPFIQESYSNLTPELRGKGKLAVDVIAGRGGKSGGAFIQSAAIMITGLNQIALTPFLYGMIMILLFAWSRAVVGLYQAREK
jgi:AAA family ATP:ADP antiporter